MPKRIILCDDELFVLRAAEIKFQRAGFEVRCAMDGEEAWELVIEWDPDIVVTDCQMPHLDGLQLAQRMHESVSFRHIPIVMLTAKGFELSAETLRHDYGVERLFAKPFSPRALLNCVEELLKNKTEPLRDQGPADSAPPAANTPCP